MTPSGPSLAELTELLCSTVRIPLPEPPLDASERLFGGRLPLDSVDSLQWAAAIERHFSIELTDDEILDGVLMTLGRLVEALASRSTEKTPAAHSSPP